jgi:ABC-type transporter Mla subunit MlaD
MNQGQDHQKEINDVMQNIARLQDKASKLQKKIQSGQHVELSELKALNQALVGTHNTGAAW